ncbi:hypothetical protein [Clostridium ganghwense]|uniref:Uncharacterized protein n=1 Tax=Clostridium ganghwense TaxID=312089 RepID=A0ABT4CSB3_9CLOT|nr:hypothetical protein [Clostridium ganghwense]MCY6371945.1 hypothetical protein [Clostridium ganghwense]
MNKKNSFSEILDKLLKIIKLLFSKVKLFLNTIYNRLLFIFNKQETIKKMYEPIIDEKTQFNKNLQKQLLSLKEDNNIIIKKIKTCDLDNSELKTKTDMLQSLLLDNSNNQL